MKQPPTIIIQLVHIEGPLKGEIQDFPMPEVTVGRNPSCNVQFPKDLGVVSRQHARIVREGNRFKIIDQSANGTYLNGKAISEAYLKDGDVLMFAEGGPKVSFLTQTAAQSLSVPVEAVASPPEPPQEPALSPQKSFQDPVTSPEPPQIPPAWSPPVDSTPPKQAAQNVYRPPAVSSAPVQPQQPPPEGAFGAAISQEVSVQRIKKPLFVQYGPTLRSYNELPVIIGQGSQCDFVLDHPAVFERHAQVFFYQEQYWIKDLSGKNPLLINGRPVDKEGMLEPDCRLSLSPQGPEFRFLGGGRLAEIEVVPEETPEPIPGENMPGQQKGLLSSDGLKDIGGMMKRFFKK